MVNCRFFTFSSGDGTSLCADAYEPPQGRKILGPLLIVHGYCEHRGRYRETALHLAEQGYWVLTFDLRGHGQSGGTRAFIRRIDEYLADISAALAHLNRIYRKGPEEPKQPRTQPFLVGHSLGGLLSLRYALDRPAELRALALSSPFLGLKAELPAWERGLATVASMLYPSLALPNNIRSEDLTHDPALVAAHAADPLIYPKATVRWFTETQAAQQEVLRRAPQLKVPTLLMQAGEDRLVDPAASQAVFDRLPASLDKTFLLYPGLFHEILNELERERVRADLVGWLNRH